MSLKEFLTSFEQDVLLTLLDLNTGYNVSIRDRLIEIAGKEYSLETIYAILKRFEDRGLVTSRKSEPRGEKKGLLFSITDEGKAALKSSLDHLEALRASAFNRNRLI